MKRIILSAIIAIAGLFITFIVTTGKQKPEQVSIKLYAKILKDDNFQLFYTLDGGNKDFSEEESITANVKGAADLQEISFILSTEYLVNKFRLDLGTNPSQQKIIIDKIEMTALNKAIRYSTEGSFAKNNFIVKNNNNEYSLQQIEGTYDPYMVTNFDVTDDFRSLLIEQEKNPYHFTLLLSLVVSLTLFILTYLISSFLETKK